jgi:hypothetical protein
MKLAEKTHTSSKKAEKNYLPLLRTMFKNKKMKENISQSLVLDKDEISFLRKGV